MAKKWRKKAEKKHQKRDDKMVIKMATICLQKWR